MKKKSLHVRMARINDGNSSRIGATADLSELASVVHAPEKMTTLEHEYKAMIEKIEKIRARSNTDVISKWKLADIIYSFLLDADRVGVTIESHLKVMCRDTSMSRTEMKYLLKFRKTYTLKELDEKASWSTYRSNLYKKIPYGKHANWRDERKL